MTIGRGTRFSAYLPAAIDAVAFDASQKPATELLSGAGELILLVDDEAVIREIARVPIIAVSGLVEKGRSAEISAKDVQRFLKKSFSAQELLKALHEALNADSGSVAVVGAARSGTASEREASEREA